MVETGVVEGSDEGHVEDGSLPGEPLEDVRLAGPLQQLVVLLGRPGVQGSQVSGGSLRAFTCTP